MDVTLDGIYSASRKESIFKLKWFVFILVHFVVLGQKTRNKSKWIVPSGLKPPVFKTKYGAISGFYFQSVHNRQILAFQGVPYAKPPLGDLRFMPPQEPDSWEETIKATWPGTECVQSSLTKLNTRGSVMVGREDCLYLDIYTPLPRYANVYYTKLPVIVNFHGGPFTVESYQPYVLADHVDAVFVHVNYRVGPYGFLTTESSKYPGNMGLKDQVMALKWVRENIKLFNGDPENVNLLGWSLGAASVHYHYLSKQSKDLFHRGISMSGSALCPWALMERGKEKTYRLAKAVGCNTANDDSVVECLKRAKKSEIFTAINEEFRSWLYNPFLPFGPTIERPSNSIDDSDSVFLDDNPYDIIRTGKAKKAPWLVSNVERDGLFPGGHFITNASRLQELSEKWTYIAPHLLDYNYTLHFQKYKRWVARKIKKQYSGASPPSFVTGHNNPISIVQREVLEMLSDRLFKGYTGLAAQMHAKQNSTVYFYVFNYLGKNSVSKYATNTNADFGACHGDDLIYTLGSFFRGDELSSQDNNMIELMTGYWSSFLSKGKPSDTWDPVSDYKDFGKLNYLNIESPNLTTNVVEDDYGKINFWMTLNIDELLFLMKNRYYTDLFENEPDQNNGLENITNIDYEDEHESTSDVLGKNNTKNSSYLDKFDTPGKHRKISSVSLEDYFDV